MLDGKNYEMRQHEGLTFTQVLYSTVVAINLWYL